VFESISVSMSMFIFIFKSISMFMLMNFRLFKLLYATNKTKNPK
jgi:hypothetical protein